MLKKIVESAFQEALNNVDPTRPTLFILRGFSEVISKIKVPKEIEAFDPYDLDGNYPRYITGEMFQVLSIDEEIYDELDHYAHKNPQMAPANIHEDTQLSLLLFSISYVFEEHDASTKVIKTMEMMDYKFVYIDFNLYEFLKVYATDNYFPINHQPVIHMDMEIYSNLKYPGLFNETFHQIGMISYMEKMDFDPEQIKVFKDDRFIKQLSLNYQGEDIDVYEEASHAFFNYFSIFDRLN